MIDHNECRLRIILVALAVLARMSPAVLAQADADRELARARDEWKDGAPAARAEALGRLNSLGEDAFPAVPILMAALREPEPTTRVGAAQILGNLGLASRQSIAELTAHLEDPEQSVREAVAEVLATFGRRAGPSIPALVRSLRAGPDRRCPKAAPTLVAIGEPAMSAIVELLKDPDPEIRKTVVRSLAELGGFDASCRPTSMERRLETHLKALSQDADVHVRIALAEMLITTGSDSEAAIAHLRVLLRDPESRVRLALIRAAGQAHVLPDALRPVFAELLKDRNPGIRVAVATSIPWNDLTACPIVDGLLGALKDPNINVRAAACEKLAQARMVLHSIVDQGRYSTQINTSTALTRNPAAFESLKSALADSDSRVRAAAASLLPAFDGEAATSIRILTDRLKDPDATVRAHSATALAWFGPRAQSATRALLALLGDTHELEAQGDSVANHAAPALVAIGGDAKAKMLRILVAQLNSLDDKVRGRARQILISLREGVIHEMIHDFSDPRISRCVQVEVLQVLNELITGQSTGAPLVLWSDERPPGPEVLAMVPVLRSLAGHDDTEVRLAALGMLARIAPQAAEIPSMYFAYLRDGEDPDLESQWIYRIIDPAMIPGLIEGLGDVDPEIRLKVAKALSAMADRLIQAENQDPANGPGPATTRIERQARRRGLKVRAAHALLTAINDPDARVRWIAAQSLGVLAVEADRVIPALLGMLKSETGLVGIEDPVAIRSFQTEGQEYRLRPSKAGTDPLRIAAIQGLGSFADKASPAVPELVRALHDDDLRVRWFAAEALARLGPGAKAAVPALIEALRSGDEAACSEDADGDGGMEEGPIRLIAAVALGKIGPASKAAVPDLIEALSGPDSRVRGEAARALGAIGREAVAAVPELARLATRGHGGTVARLSQEALIQLGSVAVPPLLVIVRDHDPELRLAAMEILAQFGTKATGALAEVIACLNDDDPEIRAAAARASGEIGPETVAVIPALIATIDDPEADVSDAVDGALNAIGKPAVPAILALLRCDGPATRQRAFAILSHMGSSGVRNLEEPQDRARDRRQSARAALLSALGDRDQEIRSGAFEALKTIGKDAITELVAALESPSIAIRTGAARTLGAIGHDGRDALGPLRRHDGDPDPDVRDAVDSAIRAIEQSDHFEVLRIPGNR